MDFKILNDPEHPFKPILQGNLLARFDLQITGVGTFYKCGLFRDSAGNKFINLPSFNIRKYVPTSKVSHVKSGTPDKGFNALVTAVATQMLNDIVTGACGPNTKVVAQEDPLGDAIPA